MNLKPLDDRVVVQRRKAGETTVGGIFLPEMSREKPQRAKVVAVGPGRMLDSGERVPVEVKVDDDVLVGKWDGTEVKVDGDEYLILCEKDILARFV